MAQVFVYGDVYDAVLVGFFWGVAAFNEEEALIG